jgi:mannose-6-phosphate isomerase
VPRIKVLKKAARRAPVENIVVPRVRTRALPKPPPAIPIYPMRFNEIYKRKIWGGDGLRRILRKRAPPKTGESWELAQMGKDVSVVANGKLKGRSLADLYATYRKELAGTDMGVRFPAAFPLVIKLLNCQDRLSLQVHPSDDFAGRYEARGDGKMEAWYVVHAPETARVVRGVLPGITIAEFRQALEENRIEECVNTMEVAAGDVIFVPPGTIHSAYGGVILLEVQQNSDITYRLTDWGRTGFDGKPRELSVRKAISVMDFYTMGVTKFHPQRLKGFPYKRKLLLKCEKFTMDLLELGGKRVRETLDGSRCQVLTILRGKGKFRFGPKHKLREPFAAGQTFLIPAAIKTYEIMPAGVCEIVVTYV